MLWAQAAMGVYCMLKLVRIRQSTWFQIDFYQFRYLKGKWSELPSDIEKKYWPFPIWKGNSTKEEEGNDFELLWHITFYFWPSSINFLLYGTSVTTFTASGVTTSTDVKIALPSSFNFSWQRRWRIFPKWC